VLFFFVSFFFSSRRRHTRFSRDWSSDVCSSDLGVNVVAFCINKVDRVHFRDGILLSRIFLAECDRDIACSRKLADRFLVKDETRSEERRVGKESRKRRSWQNRHKEKRKRRDRYF